MTHVDEHKIWADNLANTEIQIIVSYRCTPMESTPIGIKLLF